MSDMLLDLTDRFLKKEFADDVAKRNRFREANLRQEILDKYQFSATDSIPNLDYSGGKDDAALHGGVAGISAILVAGLCTTLAPLPIGILVGSALGIVIYKHLSKSPRQNKREMETLLDSFFDAAQKQFLLWFDGVEEYFNKRANEIKKTL